MSKGDIEFIVLKRGNITDFAKERNRLLEKAKKEWVFFIDTDEKISRGLENEISKIDFQNTEFSGYYVYRKNFFLGKYVGTDKILRLIRKGSGRWERRVHEVFHSEAGRVGELENPIIHNSYKNLHEAIEKINIYSTLHAEEKLANGNRSDLIKIIFYPIMKFFQSVLIGRGFVFSMLQSFHSFLAWSKEWQLQKG